jgi:hypothetical protein
MRALRRAGCSPCLTGLASQVADSHGYSSVVALFGLDRSTKEWHTKPPAGADNLLIQMVFTE